MKKRLTKITVIAAAVMMAAMSITGCGKKAEEPAAAVENTKAETEAAKTEETKAEEKEAPARVAVVFNTNLGDKSFSDLVWNGVTKAKEDFGIEIKALELMGDATKQEPTLVELCESEEWDLIIAGTFNLKEAIEKVAAEFPEQKFIVYDTELDYTDGANSNCVSVMCKQNESAFLAGSMAALMTTQEGDQLNEENIIGFVGGGENSAVNDFLVGYIEGAKFISEDCKVLYSYVGDFKNTAKAKELAIAQYQQDADIVFAVASAAGLGVLDAAKQEDKLAIGGDLDSALQMEESDVEMSKHIMTSALKNLDVLLYNKIEEYLNGEIQWGNHEIAGLDINGVNLADNKYFRALVPEEIINQVEDIREKIISGEIVVNTAIGMSTEEINEIKAKAE